MSPKSLHYGTDFHLRLCQFHLGVGLGNDACPSAGRNVTFAQQLGAAQGNGPLAVTIRADPADPADRSGVASAIEGLEFGDSRG
jgi:hypothetical protein